MAFKFFQTFNYPICKSSLTIHFKFYVLVAGIEPATPRTSLSRSSYWATPANCGPGRIWTDIEQLAKLMLNHLLATKAHILPSNQLDQNTHLINFDTPKRANSAVRPFDLPRLEFKIIPAVKAKGDVSLRLGRIICVPIFHRFGGRLSISMHPLVWENTGSVPKTLWRANEKTRTDREADSGLHLRTTDFNSEPTS